MKPPDVPTAQTKNTLVPWSPYGCHYYPDSADFPEPNLDSLPNEPLSKGEQYYLDLAGNIRKVRLVRSPLQFKTRTSGVLRVL